MENIYFSRRKKIKKQKPADYTLTCSFEIIKKRYTILEKCSDFITAISGRDTLTFIPQKNNLYKLTKIS